MPSTLMPRHQPILLSFECQALRAASRCLYKLAAQPLIPGRRRHQWRVTRQPQDHLARFVLLLPMMRTVAMFRLITSPLMAKPAKQKIKALTPPLTIMAADWAATASGCIAVVIFHLAMWERLRHQAHRRSHQVPALSATVNNVIGMALIIRCA